MKARLSVVIAVLLVWPAAARQSKQFALDSAIGLRLVNVVVEPDVLDGKKGVRVAVSPDALRRLQTMAPDEQAKMESLAIVDGLEFGSGAIEAEIAGAPAPDAPEGARGFVGVAFRVQPDLRTYDAFYLRPTNGRADDQLRRNHSTQYISAPDFPWERLRKETPGVYESYVDLVTGAWTHMKIEVSGVKARLFVNGGAQPVLIVNDLKRGATGGQIGLWIGAGTEAYFRDLRVSTD